LVVLQVLQHLNRYKYGEEDSIISAPEPIVKRKNVAIVPAPAPHSKKKSTLSFETFDNAVIKQVISLPVSSNFSV